MLGVTAALRKGAVRPRLRVMRLILFALMCMATAASAQPSDFAAPGTETARLVIYSSLDTRLAAIVIAAFQDRHPGVTVAYEDLLTGQIAARVEAETRAGGPTADLVFLSAMDLAVKLANDGYAREVDLPVARDWPRWANWRDTAFAIAVEPAVMVYHRPAFPDGPPQSRAALIRWLETAPQGRVGTYDIDRSALGFLLFARDQEHFFDIWDLAAAMGRAGTRLFPTSQEVIDRVASGELLFGYNVLGSYAADQAAMLPDLGVVMPADFVVLISRVALIPRFARDPDLGAAFLSFLMSDDGQHLLSDQLRLPAVSPAVTGPGSLAALQDVAGDRLRPVPVGPGLLAYLDQSSRNRLLQRWQAALAPEVSGP